MLNTPENRAKFVELFGERALPDGRYRIGDEAAGIILRAADAYPERFNNPRHLWASIMQNRKTYMLGQWYLTDSRSRRARLNNSKYEAIGKMVTDEIYNFVKTLED